MRVLVFPGGTEIGLEIHAALRDCKDVELASVSGRISSHAPYVFSEFSPLPAVYEQSWVSELNRLIGHFRIDYVYPAHDDVILALANHAHEIHAGLVMSPIETCRIARFKSKTYEALNGALPIPRIYPSPAEIDAFPVFCKPDRGQGSYRARRVDAAEQLRVDFREDDLILEYLPGKEYTVDCFSDRDRGLMFVGGRERVRTRNGISVVTRPAQDPAFEAYARAISERLALHGAWFFQLKRDREGQLKLLEVGTRIAGAMALHRVMGINFPLLSLYEHRRLPLRILRHNAQLTLNRALVNRYKHDLVYRTVYVDLDDTLILRGNVNTRLLALLYQCLNRGVRLVLLTRHAHNLQETLDRHRIAQVFDEIVHLSADQPKADAIADRSAILIDDSFSERLRVYEATGIPTFDCSMIEMLLDDREFAVGEQSGASHAVDVSESATETSTAATPLPGYQSPQYAADVFAVLNVSLPAEFGKWLEIWAESPEREVFGHPAYVQLEADRLQGSAMCAVWRRGAATVMYPFIVRDLSREAYFPPEESAAYDITSPYGYGGPIVWGHGPDENPAADFWRCFDAWAGKRRIVAEFVRFPLSPETCLAYPGEKWVVAPHVVRSLQPTEDQIWEEVEHKVRKNVNKAKRSGVEVVVDPAGKNLDSFLAIYEATMDRRRVSAPYRYPRRFFERLGQEIPGGICYFHAGVGGKIVASELALVSKRNVYSFLGGTLDEYFAFRPNDLLKIEIIRWAKEQGKTAFVLGGGYRPDDGIFRYKLAFAPNGVVDYVQGGRIFNQALYERLVERRRQIALEPNARWDELRRFFPAYRA